MLIALGFRYAFLRQMGDHATKVLNTIPLGWIAEPDDVAAPMLFLSGPALRYMTGYIIYVNEGWFSP